MTALVAANSTGTSFTLSIKDATAGWMFSITQTGSCFARSSAEVIAEAPSSCSLVVRRPAGQIACLAGRSVSYNSSGPALAKPWRTPWPARAVSASGS